ncbi:MAG: aldolase/citrate lyase family protein, partial [Candidatus Tectomicrobia bacterium]|nr:aldolase/citrate lyase family protein [Candidatus Tectomicrobia bacterium]
MEPFVRRSHLIVSALDEMQVQTSWTHHADAVVLDLTDSIPEVDKPQAREGIKAAIPIASRGAAEVFVHINKPLAYADIEASAWPGLKGVVFTGAEAATDVEDIAATLETFERSRGIAHGALQMIVMLDSGKGVWNIREIIKASPRVCSIGLDEGNLCRNLGIVPNAE